MQGSAVEGRIAVGDATLSNAAADAQGGRPVLIEMLGSEQALRRHLTRLIQTAAQQQQPRNVGMMVGVNQKAGENDIGQDGRLTGRLPGVIPQPLRASADSLAQDMENAHLYGGAFPFVWGPAHTQNAEYTFPFMEARAALSLHAGTTQLVTQLVNVDDPVIRSMDADVSSDPLLEGGVATGAGSPVANLGYSRALLTGGYNWDTAPQPDAYWKRAGALPDMPRDDQVNAWNGTLATIIGLLNEGEHRARAWLVEKFGARAIYWPEPNTYQPSSDRVHGGARSRDKGKDTVNTAQQNEGAEYIPQGPDAITGVYDRTMATTKPLKTYFDRWAALVIACSKGEKNDLDQQVTALIKTVRQTHLNIDDLVKIARKSGMPGDEISYLKDKATPVLNRTIAQLSAAIIRRL